MRITVDLPNLRRDDDNEAMRGLVKHALLEEWRTAHVVTRIGLYGATEASVTVGAVRDVEGKTRRAAGIVAGVVRALLTAFVNGAAGGAAGGLVFSAGREAVLV